MGASVPENLGRRYFYCNARRAGKPVCAYGEDTWSPALADTLRTRLNDALELFGNEVRSGSSIRAATNKGLAAFKAAERAQREAAEFSNQLVNPPVGIDIFIYLEAGDMYLQERRSTSNGCYSLYSDSNLCDLTNFPARRWSVYDRFIKKFIPIPTFSNFTVIKGEFLVIRPSSFADKDCEGLDRLILKLESHELPEPQHLKRIRGAGAGEGSGPSKRVRHNKDVVDLTDLD
ncbi:hypothetical protein GALMADRAFT_145417 [Galerina marginata CBS 339.88]|uniref:Uncharacterized protein n=1 Tax=Galerina marginata (strain CBS 339.88) TaxID=685588 RepID=A0A067SI63_GALM3|nr:hypothetical protein GALMADRAFT_145417 [Galerina marginata CBS 339.88]